jgi:predicted component of type VI protein secretion system
MNAKDQAAELREQAERTREALGETVQQLSDKLDVQARANEGLQKAGAKAQQVAATAADKAQQVAATTAGKAQQVAATTAGKAQQVAATTAGKAQQATAQVRDTAMHTIIEAERKIDDLPEAVREPAHRTMDVVRQRPAMVLLGMVGLIVLLRLLLRRSHD